MYRMRSSSLPKVRWCGDRSKPVPTIFHPSIPVRRLLIPRHGWSGNPLENSRPCHSIVLGRRRKRLSESSTPSTARSTCTAARSCARRAMQGAAAQADDRRNPRRRSRPFGVGNYGYAVVGVKFLQRICSRARVMELKSTQIGDFRRFTDLAVQEIRATAQPIVLAGPNGRGNSASRSQASSRGSPQEPPQSSAKTTPQHGGAKATGVCFPCRFSSSWSPPFQSSTWKEDYPPEPENRHSRGKPDTPPLPIAQRRQRRKTPGTNPTGARSGAIRIAFKCFANRVQVFCDFCPNPVRFYTPVLIYVLMVMKPSLW